MWPLSGERWVDVCGTIVPPVRARRRWRILPVISAPGAGERIARRAVDRGRTAGAVVTAPPGLRGPHPAAKTPRRRRRTPAVPPETPPRRAARATDVPP